jgi:hypothetical protein
MDGASPDLRECFQGPLSEGAWFIRGAVEAHQERAEDEGLLRILSGHELELVMLEQNGWGLDVRLVLSRHPGNPTPLLIEVDQMGQDETGGLVVITRFYIPNMTGETVELVRHDAGLSVYKLDADEEMDLAMLLRTATLKGLA